MNMYRRTAVFSLKKYSRAVSCQSVPVQCLCTQFPAVSEERSHKSWFSAFLMASIVAGTSLLTSTYCDEERKNITPEKIFSTEPPVPKRPIEQDTKKNFVGIKLFTGNANIPLATDIANHLGMNLGKISVSHYADGEVNVMVNENVRGKDVYIVQPTSPPVNETLMELLLMISTMRRASARKITAVVPYYGYARQDRKMAARVPISAADVARLLEAMGVDRVVAVDLHCGQIQGFFGPRVPVDNLDGGTVGVSYFGDMDLINPVVVSPDAGGVYRAKKFREALSKKHEVDSGLAMIVKQRAKANQIESMDLVGSVDGCDAIIVDDMVDTAGTLCKAAEVLKEFGARRVYAFCSHGVLSGPAAERISKSALTELVVLDTVPLSEESKQTGKITQLSVGPLLAQAIYNIHNKKSISALFK